MEEIRCFPVDMVNIPVFLGFFYNQPVVGLGISGPSTVCVHNWFPFQSLVFVGDPPLVMNHILNLKSFSFHLNFQQMETSPGKLKQVFVGGYSPFELMEFINP